MQAHGQVEEWRNEQLSISNTFKKIHKDLPEIKKTIESLPPLIQRILEDDDRNTSPQIDISYFIKNIYMGIVGAGFLIAGVLTYGFNSIASFVIIAIGLSVLLISKPKH